MEKMLSMSPLGFGLERSMFKSGAEPHSGLGGAVAPAKKFFFPLDYEEKKNRPPQHYTTSPPTHFSPILLALNQKLGTPSNRKKKKIICYTFKQKKKKKTQKKFELKSEKKKIYIYIYI